MSRDGARNRAVVAVACIHGSELASGQIKPGGQGLRGHKLHYLHLESDNQCRCKDELPVFPHGLTFFDYSAQALLHVFQIH
jgi:hypothetical protein